MANRTILENLESRVRRRREERRLMAQIDALLKVAAACHSETEYSARIDSVYSLLDNLASSLERLPAQSAARSASEVNYPTFIEMA